MNLLGIVGAAGAGRRTVAEHLRAQGFCTLAFEDPIRKIVRDTWGLPADVLWGSSELRECPLFVCAACGYTYPILPGNTWECVCPSCEEPEGAPIMVPSDGTTELTPRLALQRIGTEVGRALDPDVWVRMGLRRARSLVGAIHPGAGSGPLDAHRDADGTFWPALSCLGDEGRVRGVVITDCRFQNESEAIRAAGGRIWRVEGVTRCLSCYIPVIMPPLCEDCAREGAERRLTDRELAAAEEAWRGHASETEGAGIEADFVVRNDGTLDDLREKVVSALAEG